LLRSAQDYNAINGVIIAYLFHIDTTLRGLPASPDLIEEEEDKAACVLMIHKALLGLSAHRDGLAEGRMTGLLRVALCEHLPDSKSLRPLMASAAQKISSRLIYALKQCWR